MLPPGIGLGLTNFCICSGEHALPGLYSSKNHSWRVGQPLQGRVPVIVQILTLLIPSGAFQSIEGESARITNIILFQIGAAPVIPETIRLMDELSLFPTHVRTKKFWLKPTVQLSLRSLLVPVLTAISGWFFTTRLELKPNSGARAVLSFRMSISE